MNLFNKTLKMFKRQLLISELLLNKTNVENFIKKNSLEKKYQLLQMFLKEPENKIVTKRLVKKIKNVNKLLKEEL